MHNAHSKILSAKFPRGFKKYRCNKFFLLPFERIVRQLKDRRFPGSKD